MTYLHLKSPEGEPFEVIEQRAGKLLTEGWTFNPAPLAVDTPRIDEVVETVTVGTPVESNGAIVDAQTFAEDTPVEVEQAPEPDAGPQEDVTDVPNVVSDDYEAPVEAQEEIGTARTTRRR